MPTPILHHQAIVSPDRKPPAMGGTDPPHWLLVLHGVYGQGRNWATIARRVVTARPDWGVVLVDLREHGESHGFEPPHTLDAAAGDVLNLAAFLGLRRWAMLGHSFGGKVALQAMAPTAAGESRPTPGQLTQAWVIDSTPDAFDPSGDAWQVMQMLKTLPDAYPDRQAGIDALLDEGLAMPIATWLASNLKPRGGEYAWRFDIAHIEALLRDFYASDLWPIVESPARQTHLHVVKAEASPLITEKACARIEAAQRATLHRIHGGHWVNAENPDAMVALLVDNL